MTRAGGSRRGPRHLAAMEPAEYRPDDRLHRLHQQLELAAAMEPAEYRPDDRRPRRAAPGGAAAAMEPAEYRPDDAAGPAATKPARTCRNGADRVSAG